jgi:membrane protein required for colicin V production
LPIVDIVLLGILSIGAFIGFKKGLMMELVAIFAFLLAIVLSFKLLNSGIHLLGNYLETDIQWLTFLAFIIIFIITVVGVTLLGKVIKKVIDLTLLGSMDKIAGAIVGALKWAFGLSLIIWLADLFDVKPSQDMLSSSIIYPYMIDLAPTMIDFIGKLLPLAKDLIQSIKELFNHQAV